jgi:hypothetical protein
MLKFSLAFRLDSLPTNHAHKVRVLGERRNHEHIMPSTDKHKSSLLIVSPGGAQAVLLVI